MAVSWSAIGWCPGYRMTVACYVLGVLRRNFKQANIFNQLVADGACLITGIDARLMLLGHLSPNPLSCHRALMGFIPFGAILAFLV